eukprot:3882860-Rhodomonas_salina.1
MQCAACSMQSTALPAVPAVVSSAGALLGNYGPVAYLGGSAVVKSVYSNYLRFLLISKLDNGDVAVILCAPRAQMQWTVNVPFSINGSIAKYIEYAGDIVHDIPRRIGAGAQTVVHNNTRYWAEQRAKSQKMYQKVFQFSLKDLNKIAFEHNKDDMPTAIFLLSEIRGMSGVEKVFAQESTNVTKEPKQNSRLSIKNMVK